MVSVNWHTHNLQGKSALVLQKNWSNIAEFCAYFQIKICKCNYATMNKPQNKLQ
jgi:hypothetical protein